MRHESTAIVSSFLWPQCGHVITDSRMGFTIRVPITSDGYCGRVPKYPPTKCPVKDVPIGFDISTKNIACGIDRIDLAASAWRTQGYTFADVSSSLRHDTGGCPT